MERIQLINELAQTQASLLDRYAQLTQAKAQFETRFEQLKAELEPFIPTFGPPRDAFIDLPDRLNNQRIETEAKRVADALSRLIGHLSAG